MNVTQVKVVGLDLRIGGENAAAYTRPIVTAELEHHFKYVNDIVASKPQANQTLIVFLHGFPEVWIVWKEQMKLFMNTLRYRVVALDMVGYGQSDVPRDLLKYTYQSVGSDIIHLIQNELGHDSAILMGHNWGSHVAFHMARVKPELISSVISLSSGYYPTPLLPRSLINRVPQLGYQLNLANPNHCPRFDQHVGEFLAAFWSYSYNSVLESCLAVPPDADFIDFVRKTNKQPLAFPDSDIKHYITDQFKASGTWGATNWYRTSDLNYQFAQHLPNRNLSLPVMLMVGQNDFAAPSITAGSQYLSNYSIEIVPDAGHFLHLSHANLVFSIIYRWLSNL